MERAFRNTLLLWFLIAAAILATEGFLVDRSIRRLATDLDRVNHTHQVLAVLGDTLSSLKDTQSAQRGYVLTGDESYLDPMNVAIPRIEDDLRRLKLLTIDNPVQQERVESLKQQTQERVAFARFIVEVRRQKGFVEAQRLILSGRGENQTDRVRAIASEMEQEERSLLQQRVFAASKSTQETILTGGVGVGVVFLIFALVFSQVRRENLGRREVEAQLQQANVVLTQNLLTVEQWGNEMKLLSAMSEMLQSCRSQEEAFVIIHRTIRQLLPDETGALCIINSSRTLADSMLSWGEDQAELSQLLFDPEQCWGLRRGQSYLVEDTTIGVTCGHISAESAKSPSTTLCLPLLAHGEMMGLLYVRAPRPASLSLDKQHAARAAADQIALSLSNLRLQDKLRHQAIRDPLTGLYNRRYMEASLERELARAIRHQHPLSIIMTDVDHFKRYNDTFGHEAGDLLLQEFGALLKKRCRADDIACRYGGEEFMLIMPEASCEVARQRAEQLRETVKQLRVEYRNQMLGAVTISLGLATFPLHGSNGDDVLRAADRALYQAKQSGRDRVVVIDELNPSPLNGTMSKEHRDEAELPPAEAA